MPDGDGTAAWRVSGTPGSTSFAWFREDLRRYYVFGRVNGPSADDDSIYIKVDDGLLLDELKVTSFAYGPTEAGEREASNLCSLP